jgi:hypothetical protein
MVTTTPTELPTTDTTAGDIVPAPAAETRAALVPLLFGFFPTQVLHVGARLGVADLLANGPRTTDDLAAATSTHPPSLYRVLRALACFGVLAEVAPGTFARDGRSSIRHLIELFAGHDVWRAWGELDASVRTGDVALERITGMTTFEHMAANPELQATFNKAMSEGTRNAAPGIVDAGRFERFSSVVDVGGGDGTLLAAVLAATPGLRGTVFDLATGLADAPATLAAAGVADRADVTAGDVFESVPTGADAYLIKSVIHDWDDERTVAILGRIRAAIGDAGTLLIVEPVMPSAPSATPDVLMMVMSDLNMLVCTGGKERTATELRTLLAHAGFALQAITPVSGPTNYSVIEATPA